MKRPSLRYFARFRGDYGYLRAVVRYESTRKCITTPLVITRSQLSKLDTSGTLEIEPGNTSDALLCGRLKAYTAIVWHVVRPLIQSGKFAATKGEELTEAINKAQAQERKASYKRMMAAQGHNVDAMPQEAFEPGLHYADGRPMSAEDIAKVEAILSKGPWPSYEEKHQGKEADNEK